MADEETLHDVTWKELVEKPQQEISDDDIRAKLQKKRWPINVYR